MLSIAAMLDHELEQRDVKIAFLHGDLEEELYMSQPEGFMKKGAEQQVCLLKKSLYGLKQSPRQWYKKFDEFMMQQGFQRSKFDSCVYFTAIKNKSLMYFLIYVDDMLIASNDKSEIDALKRQLNKRFSMKNLGAASRILGIDIKRDRSNKELVLSLQHYLEKVLKGFGMLESKAVTTPIGAHFKLQSVRDEDANKEAEFMKDIPYASCVGSVMYSMVNTRPDLAYGIGLISRFMSKPAKEHWQTTKWLLRYIRGTTDLKLV